MRIPVNSALDTLLLTYILIFVECWLPILVHMQYRPVSSSEYATQQRKQVHKTLTVASGACDDELSLVKALSDCDRRFESTFDEKGSAESSNEAKTSSSSSSPGFASPSPSVAGTHFNDAAFQHAKLPHAMTVGWLKFYCRQSTLSHKIHCDRLESVQYTVY